MSNLFSSFDPTVSIMGMDLMLNWSSAIIGVIILPQGFWLVDSQPLKSVKLMMSFLSEELGAVLGAHSIPGCIFMYVSLFFFIFFSNFMGLMPYIFTCTSHLSMTLTLSLPLWLGSMLMSILLQYNSLMAHLVPSGTPGFLMPIMVIIETVSNIIRPATLAIRLAANMVAGHLLLTLLGSQGPNLAFVGLIGLVIALILLLLLEVAVACIQSYVFTILSSLYLGELTTPGFTLKMTK